MLWGLTIHRPDRSHWGAMAATLLRSTGRSRRHGDVLQPAARRHLERDGWRTTLEYRENHVRGTDGQLLRVEPCWLAEAERFDGEVTVARVEAASADAAWEGLLDKIERAEVQVLRRVRVCSPR